MQGASPSGSPHGRDGVFDSAERPLSSPCGERRRWWWSPVKLSRPLPGRLGSPRALAGDLASGRLVRSVLLPAAAHLVPSTLVLGQWWPFDKPALRALPGGLCRWRGPDTGRPEVSITFDDGPDPDRTPYVLDLLEERGMRATFFCLGERVDHYPEVVKEVLARGHEIGTHGFRHQSHLFRSATQLVEDLRLGLESLERVDPQLRPRHFRPPYGQVSAGTVVAAQRCGLDMVLWSAWGREWSDRSPDSVAHRIINRIEPSTIILLHDSDAEAPRGTAAIGLDALSRVLDHLDDLGLRSVPVAELIRP